MTPSRNVGFVLERHPDGQSVDRRASVDREMKYRLVIVIEIATTRDRLEMAERIVTDAHGFDPGDLILKHKTVAEGPRDVERDPRIGIGIPDIEKKRPVRLEHAAQGPPDLGKPSEVGGARPAVVVAAVCDPDIVRG